MANIEKRRTKDGRTRYRVGWRLGGSRLGDRQSETFDTKADALVFRGYALRYFS